MMTLATTINRPFGTSPLQSKRLQQMAVNDLYFSGLTFQGESETIQKQSQKQSLWNRLAAKVENWLGAVDRFIRSIAGSLFYFTHRRLIDESYEKVKKLDVESPDFTDAVIKIFRYIANGRETEINATKGVIRDLAESDEACIFVMNHDYRLRDAGLLSVFGAMLYQAYKDAGKTATCPRPKVLLNEDILSTVRPELREILEKLGAVGVDARITAKNDKERNVNGRQMLSVIREFRDDNANVFIFPEGKLSAFKRLSLREKFQPGVAEMVRIAANGKERVKVVPIGLSYKQGIGTVEIGDPVYFKKTEEGHLMVNSANLSRSGAPRPYQKFFWGKQRDAGIKEDGVKYRTLTRKGEPVTGKEVNKFISGILVANLEAVRRQARIKQPRRSLGEDVLIR